MKSLKISLLLLLLISSIAFAAAGGPQGNVYCSINAHGDGWEVYWGGMCISGPEKLGRHETITIQLPTGYQEITAKYYYGDTLLGVITDEVYVLPGTVWHCFVE
ncbi:MAG: hypothetical protein K8R76_02800 [Candidatus Aegiribacteria sp.]|nr:hypothetical protein [Candidatus Aegiribacteria sp.]